MNAPLPSRVRLFHRFPLIPRLALILMAFLMPLGAQEKSRDPASIQNRGFGAKLIAVPVKVIDQTKHSVPHLRETGSQDVDGKRIYTHEVEEISGGAAAAQRVSKPVAYQPLLRKAKTPPRIIASPQTPVLGSSFDAIDFDGDGANHASGGLTQYHIPPDPCGAAGPHHVVCVVNTSVEWYEKDGTFQNTQRLGTNATGSITGSFFSSLTPVNNLFDPKVIYDQYEGRFLVVALERVDLGAGDPGNSSRILLAVSDDDNPNGTWYGLAIDSKISISSTDHWADYPGFAVDDSAVYVTNNMFTFGSGPTLGGARLWIVHKGVVGGFYSGSGATVTVHDPPGSVSQSAVTMQPSHMFGTPQSTMGTFLVRYSGYTDGTDEFLSIIRVDDPLGTPSFSHQFVALGNIDTTAIAMPNAPQLGSVTTVRTNDRRALNAVWRDNALWASTTIVPPSGSDAGQATAHWFKVNTTTLGLLTLSDQGSVGGEDIASNTYTFFPSIAVDASGNMGMVFSASSSTIYPGAYFTGRFSTDPAGSTVGSGVLRTGIDYYVRTFGGTNRWGDYTATSIDPSDGSFWIFNQYADTRGTAISGEDGRWATAFGNFAASALPIQLASFVATVLRDQDVELTWQTVSETNNYGFEIQRKRGDRGEWRKIGFVDGHGTTVTPQNYSYVDWSVPFGKYNYRIKQIDLDGKFKIFPESEVTVGLARESLLLAQNYPNPFNPRTAIEFAVPEHGYTSLKVYNVLGQEVATLFAGLADPGRLYSADFDARNLASGIYFYRLQSAGRIESKRMMLIK